MSYDLAKLQNVKRGPGGAITARCPVCAAAGGDKSGNHLGILADGRFNCIVGSGEPGHNRQIRALLKGYHIEDVEFIEPPRQPTDTVDKVYSEEMLSKLVKDHTYWINRGIRKEIVEMLEGGVSAPGDKSKLSGRYVIPIRGLTGQINGFSGRILNDSTFAPKYKHLFKSSRACWPWHLSGGAIEKTKKVVLQEGWSEWLALANGGIMNTLSLFGLNISDIMVGQLIAAGVEEVIISTNDDADEGRQADGKIVRKGKYSARKIKNKLDNFFDPARVKIRHPKSDWGDATKEEMEAFGNEIA